MADEKKIQIMIKKEGYENEEEFNKIKELIKRGDIVGSKGNIGRSKTGELTVMSNHVKLLSPCLHMLPKPD